MSTNKHTPGPWNAHHDHGWLVVESETGDLYVKVEKGSTAQKHMANARLIAAAPDLFEALQLADLMLSGVNMNPGVVKRKVRSAIAKATGENQ